jgi:hypothetical protein
MSGSRIDNYRQAQSQEYKKKEKTKYIRINMSRRPTNMRKQNTVFVKDVNVPSHKIRMRRKIIGNEKADSRMEWQAMFPLKH